MGVAMARAPSWNDETACAPSPVLTRSVRALVGLWRLARVVVHVLRGVAIVALRFRRLDAKGRQGHIGRWSLGLLHALGIGLVSEGQFRSRATLVAANHVSWLDIAAVHAVCPQARFVSKADVRHWPLLGWLIGAAGALFSARGRERGARARRH